MNTEELAQMSAEERRIRIAELCGYTNVHQLIVRNVQHQGDDRTCGITSDQGWIPDYLNDLNAMHEAREALSEIQQAEYAKHLADLSDLGDFMSPDDSPDYYEIFDILNAPPSRHADAFLLTLG